MNPIAELVANMLQTLFEVYTQLILAILRGGLVALLVLMIALALADR